MFRVITYNLWHGLLPEGVVRLREIEPATRRRERQSLQKECLQKRKAQVIFLQEVNPVHERSRELSDVVGLNVHFHRDNSGVKLGRIGLPINLDSGLCTLIDDSQHVEWTRGVALSGSARAFVKNPMSVQWSESRFAFLVSTYNPQFGRTLWVNTHFHHGIEMSEEILEQLKNIRVEGLISESVEQELKNRLLSADQRRLAEVDTLLETLAPIRSRYNLIVLGGDLNATPNSEVLRRLQAFGFASLTEPEAPTWNPALNHANHMLCHDFIPALLLEDLSFNQKVVERLHFLARGWERRERKIDYILGWAPGGSFALGESVIFGQELPGQMAPSDHFGLEANFELKLTAPV